MNDSADAKAPVVVYPAPADEKPCDLYTLKVNGQPVFVYQARVSAKPLNKMWTGEQRPLDQTELAGFATWDMAGPVEVEVVSSRPAGEVIIRPLRLGIKPEVSGNRITFKLDAPGPVVVEVDGIHGALHLFANHLETGAPAPDAPGVRYFGPGIHRPGRIELKSNETVYIAGGAVVHGVIHAADAEHVRVMGRGILDASTFERRDRSNIR
ncbi:MAG: endopolygalacturonase, partial [bacterium]|nr:endopolygalacturonase [bacterium]